MIVTSNLIQITSPSQDPFSVFIRSTIIQQTKIAYQKMYGISILPPYICNSIFSFIQHNESFIKILILFWIEFEKMLCITYWCVGDMTFVWKFQPQDDAIYHVNNCNLATLKCTKGNIWLVIDVH